MTAAGVTFKARDLVRSINLKINIKGGRAMYWRLRAGAVIFRLGARVVGIRSETTIEVIEKE